MLLPDISDITVLIVALRHKHPGAMLVFQDDLSGVIAYKDQDDFCVLFNNLTQLGDYLFSDKVYEPSARIDLSTGKELFRADNMLPAAGEPYTL